MKLAVAVPVLLALSGVLVSSALAEVRSIADFYGTYVGHSISVWGEGLSERDLGVVIQPRDQGFNVEWTTVTQEPDGELKRKSYSIDFRPTARENIFAAAMRPNLFGGWEPLDPMKGDPYVWARLRGDTLTVYALLVTADGSYEMQVYDRALTDEGMRLVFSRYREGREMRQITGALTRQSG